MGVAWIGIAMVVLDALGTVVGYLLWGWPALLVGLPLLVGGVIVTVVLVLTSARRRLVRELARAGMGGAPMRGQRRRPDGGPGGSGAWPDDSSAWLGFSDEFFDGPGAHDGARGRDADCGPERGGSWGRDAPCDSTAPAGTWPDGTSSGSWDGSPSSSSGSDSSSWSSSDSSSGSDSSSSSSW
jgi:hypothetical protein